MDLSCSSTNALSEQSEHKPRDYRESKLLFQQWLRNKFTVAKRDILKNNIYGLYFKWVKQGNDCPKPHEISGMLIKNCMNSAKGQG